MSMRSETVQPLMHQVLEITSIPEMIPMVIRSADLIMLEIC